MEDALQYDLCPNCKLNVPFRAKKCPHCHEWMPESSALSKKIAIGATIVWTVFIIFLLIYISMTEDKSMPVGIYIIVPMTILGMYIVVKGFVDRFINWIM